MLAMTLVRRVGIGQVQPSEPNNFFEADKLWRAYQLDLSDLYEHLVAWKVARLSCPSATMPEGSTWIDPNIDGAAIEPPDPDWNPPECGVLEFSVQGPMRELNCKYTPLSRASRDDATCC